MISTKRETSLKLDQTTLYFFVSFITIILWPVPFGSTVSYSILMAVTAGIIALGFLYFNIHFPKKIILIIMPISTAWTLIIFFPTILYNSKNLIPSDIFEIHRPIIYSLAFCFPFLISGDRKKILKIYVTTVFSALILTLLFFYFRNYLLAESSLLYNGGVGIAGKTTRARSVFGNPYDFAYALVPIVLWSCCHIANGNKLFGACLLALVSVAILATKSRTGIIISTVGVAYIASLKFFFSKQKIGFIFLSFAIGCGLIASVDFIKSKHKYLYYGLSTLAESGLTGNGSSAKRLVDITRSIKSIDENNRVLTGNGVAKATKEGRLLESQYALYIHRYGLIGLMWLFALLTSVALFTFIVWRILIRQPAEYGWLSDAWLSLHGWAFITPLAGYGNPFIDQPRLSLFFFSLAGVSFIFLNDLAKKKKN